MEDIQNVYEDMMREQRGPTGGEPKGIVSGMEWSNIWRKVSRTTAQIANDQIKQTFIPAFMGASVSRDKGGQFAKLSKVNQADYPLFTRWFNSLRKFSQTIILQQWSPIRAPFFSRSVPQLRVEVNPRDLNHFDMTDQMEEIIWDSMTEALVQDAETWVGPLLQDYLVADKPHNVVH